MLLLLLLLIPKRRARLALCLKSDATLTSLVADTLTAQLLGVTTVAGFPNDAIGHGKSHIFGEREVGERHVEGFKKMMPKCDVHQMFAPLRPVFLATPVSGI